MARNKVKGSKGQLRSKLINTATRVHELSILVGALVRKAGGTVTVTSEELEAIKPDSIIDIDRGEEHMTLTFREEPELTGEDLGITPIPETDDRSRLISEYVAAK